MPPKPQHEVHGQDANAAIRINYDSCIGCQACARACSDNMALYVMKGSKPKFPPIVAPTHGVEDTTTETTRVRLADSDCIGCGQCVISCAFNALRPESKLTEVFAAKRAGKKLVAVLSPSVRMGVGEALGMPPGKSAESQLIVHLRKIGFDYVFDNLWGADGTTTEDAKEILKAKQRGTGTVFTSCCPAWVRLVETRYPELIPQLSTARSPHGIVCSAIRNFWVPDMKFKQEDVVVVGFMPCTAKKFEAERKELTTEGVPDCDISVTSRELAEYFQEQGFKFSEEQEAALRSTTEAHCDEPFAQVSGGAYIFGKTAGVAETVVRYVFGVHGEKFDPAKMEVELYWEHKDKTQTIKILKFTLDGTSYRIGVCHGGQALVQMLKVYKDLNLDGVEVMMCPLGCQNGGGQPRQARIQVTATRAQALDQHDRESKFGSCFDNEQYKQYIKDHTKNEEDIHKYLHTHFTDRSK